MKKILFILITGLLCSRESFAEMTSDSVETSINKYLLSVIYSQDDFKQSSEAELINLTNTATKSQIKKITNVLAEAKDIQEIKSKITSSDSTSDPEVILNNYFSFKTFSELH